MARGYYLALTFGTLLSSQGADAQQLHPLGLHRQRLVHLTPSAAACSLGVLAAGPRGGFLRIHVQSTGQKSQKAATRNRVTTLLSAGFQLNSWVLQSRAGSNNTLVQK
jgi:hypothetical protein